MEEFPSVYIEGAAASGKTTAVQMLLEKHPEVAFRVFFMDRELREPDRLLEQMNQAEERMRTEILWIIFENLPGELPERVAAGLKAMILCMPMDCRVIILGREKPGKELLELFWKRKLEWISQEILCFRKEEIQSLAKHLLLSVDAEDIWRVTGGWPGCVDVMLRLYKKDAEEGREPESAEGMRSRSEVNGYIQREILEQFSERERWILERAAVCPWLNEKLCFSVWDLENAEEQFRNLWSKGGLVREKNRWKIAPLFQQYRSAVCENQGVKAGNSEGKISRIQKEAGEWYVKEGHIREALWCLKQSGEKGLHRAYMLEHYNRIPFLNIPYDEVMEWKENIPQICYLRGMCCYERQDSDGLKQEILLLRGMDEGTELQQEVLLNLLYVNPEVTLEEWLEELNRNQTGTSELHLYGLPGNSLTFLCGLRDLAGMFACTKKEENRRAKIWKDNLGEEEWGCYCLARLDYYLETERGNSIREEDRDILLNGFGEMEAWNVSLVRMYLLYKLQRIETNEEIPDRIRELESVLQQEEDPTCHLLTETVSSLYAFGGLDGDRFSVWLRNQSLETARIVKKETYMALFFRVKGYLLLNQYDRAEKVLKKLLPYVKYYHNYRLLAELLFEEAIIKAQTDLHGQAVRCVIESFLMTGSNRYVRFYTDYGEKGLAVLESYAEWMHSNAAEGWHRKKKYNYGNVVRMPVQDYLGVILRCAKRRSDQMRMFSSEYQEEQLTMMETIVLQGIGRGLTNEELCEELGVKMPTVKSHVYNLYKKLGVGSRVQAVLKGRERGIIS